MVQIGRKFASNISDKRLIVSRIYVKKTLQLNSKNSNNPIENMKRHKQVFHQRGYKDGK